MTIRLKPDQERVIGEAIQAGLIKSAEDVVDLGIETIQRQLEVRGQSGAMMSAEEWLREFHTWVHSHPTTTPLLSDEAISRESVYGTRGH
jgi:hypothetical protein